MTGNEQKLLRHIESCEAALACDPPPPPEAAANMREIVKMARSTLRMSNQATWVARLLCPPTAGLLLYATSVNHNALMLLALTSLLALTLRDGHRAWFEWKIVKIPKVKT